MRRNLQTRDWENGDGLRPGQSLISLKHKARSRSQLRRKSKKSNLRRKNPIEVQNISYGMSVNLRVARKICRSIPAGQTQSSRSQPRHPNQALALKRTLESASSLHQHLLDGGENHRITKASINRPKVGYDMAMANN